MDVTRDSLDRVTRAAYADGSHVDFAYDAGGNLLSATFVRADGSTPSKLTFSVTGDNGTAPRLSGTAPAGSTVRVYVDGSLAGTATAGADGSWSYGLSGLPVGTHGVSVDAVDASGNVLGASDTSTVTVAASDGGGGGGNPSSAASSGGGGGCGIGSGMAAALAGLALLPGLRRRRK